MNKLLTVVFKNDVYIGNMRSSKMQVAVKKLYEKDGEEIHVNAQNGALKFDTLDGEEWYIPIENVYYCILQEAKNV